MAHDRDYFRRREAELRAAAFGREDSDDCEIAGQLALAYAALARRHRADSSQPAPAAEDGVEA